MISYTCVLVNGNNHACCTSVEYFLLFSSTSFELEIPNSSPKLLPVFGHATVGQHSVGCYMIC